MKRHTQASTQHQARREVASKQTLHWGPASSWRHSDQLSS